MIHKFELDGIYLVLDINSGAVHVVDRLVYRILDYIDAQSDGVKCDEELIIGALCEEFGKAEILEAFGEVMLLIQMGHLFSPDNYSELRQLMDISPVKAMCLHVAHDCNMSCEYCFAGKGDYSGQRMVMSSETARAAIDYLIAHSKGRRNLEVDFFGGEPLLNFETVKDTVAYARSLEAEHDKIFRFTITTNGLLLTDDKIDFINKEMSNVVLSLDGRPNVNDRVRKPIAGSRSCYELVIPNFRRLVEKRGEGQYYVRGTFTKYNLDFAKDVIHLYEAGFDQISVEPVVANPSLPYAITNNDLPVVKAEYERLTKEMLRRETEGDWFNFFHFMMDLEQGPCAIKRLRGCGCGNEYVAVTPDGEVYPCHQFVGHPEWKMGDIFTGDIDMQMKAEFASSTVYGKPTCRDCWAKFYCSGGCNANSQIYNGDITKPHEISCELEKKRIECALYIKAATFSEEAV